MVGQDPVEWIPALTLAGTLIELGGHDAEALQYRIGQAMKQFGACPLTS